MTDAASTIAATCSVEHQYMFSKKTVRQEMPGFSANETLCAISKMLRALGHVVIEKNDGPLAARTRKRLQAEIYPPRGNRSVNMTPTLAQ